MLNATAIIPAHRGRSTTTRILIIVAESGLLAGAPVRTVIGTGVGSIGAVISRTSGSTG